MFDGKKLNLSDEEWKKRLTPEQYRVLRKKGTEPAFENAYYAWKKKGKYLCAGCGLELFSSDAKFDSGTGWPSFWESIRPENVSFRKDGTRIEVVCSRCGRHLVLCLKSFR